MIKLWASSSMRTEIVWFLVSMKGDYWLSQYDQLDNKITDTYLVRCRWNPRWSGIILIYWPYELVKESSIMGMLPIERCRAKEKLIFSVKLPREKCSECWEAQTKRIIEQWTSWVGLSRLEVHVNQKSSLKVKILKQDEWGSIFQKTGKMHCISSNSTSIAYLFCRYFTKENS